MVAERRCEESTLRHSRARLLITIAIAPIRRTRGFVGLTNADGEDDDPDGLEA
jgi:hypothetical protein